MLTSARLSVFSRTGAGTSQALGLREELPRPGLWALSTASGREVSTARFSLLAPNTPREAPARADCGTEQPLT